MDSLYHFVLLAYDAFMTYNPITLANWLSLQLTPEDTCPAPFWGLVGFIIIQAVSIPPFFLLFFFIRDLEKRGENNLLHEFSEMDEYEQIEAIRELCLERNIPYRLDWKEEEIVASEKQKC
jgi:hypothetical protein